MSHRTRRILVDDLPDAERPQQAPRQVPWRQAPLRCDYVEVCQDCGHRGFVETEHDWETTRGGYQCRRCGEWWNDEA